MIQRNYRRRRSDQNPVQQERKELRDNYQRKLSTQYLYYIHCLYELLLNHLPLFLFLSFDLHRLGASVLFLFLLYIYIVTLIYKFRSDISTLKQSTLVLLYTVQLIFSLYIVYVLASRVRATCKVFILLAAWI